MQDFIGRYQCDHDICDNLLKYFEENKQKHIVGLTSNALNKDVKDSTDLEICTRQNVQEPIDNYLKHLFKSLFNFVEKYPLLGQLQVFGITEPIIIQHYKVGGGFKTSHCERTGGFDKSIKRVLVFMTYLNDVEDGGTTFDYLNHTEIATKGKTLIWSSDWTHTHKGQISYTKEKTIITGWFSHMWD